VLRWPRVAWLHLPAAAWAAAVELVGWTCPLTPLEDGLRGATTHGSFVERTILPILYPAALTREIQVALGAGVLAVNVAVYALAHFFPRHVSRRLRRRAAGG
jgi:hypothetical protein